VQDELDLRLVDGKDIPDGAVVYLQPMVATTSWPTGIPMKERQRKFYVNKRYLQSLDKDSLEEQNFRLRKQVEQMQSIIEKYRGKYGDVL
jgi:hypothetical protein